MICEICGYVGEMGPSINGTVYSSGDEYTEITLELYDENSTDPIKTITLYGTVATYLIKDIPSGTYALKISKEGHATRCYSVTVEDTTTELDINIFENGDANMDSTVDVLDYQQAINILVSDENKVPEYTTADSDYIIALCDFDGDGVVDVIDCAMMAIETNAGGETQYDSLEITGITAPAANSLPSYDVVVDDNKYELYPENYGYIYNGVTWYDLTEDSNIDVDDKFIASHTYKVTIEVIPRNGEEWRLKYATINGNTALVEEASDCYLVSYVFDVA